MCCLGFVFSNIGYYLLFVFRDLLFIYKRNIEFIYRLYLVIADNVNYIMFFPIENSVRIRSGNVVDSKITVFIVKPGQCFGDILERQEMFLTTYT